MFQFSLTHLNKSPNERALGYRTHLQIKCSICTLPNVKRCQVIEIEEYNTVPNVLMVVFVLIGKCKLCISFTHSKILVVCVSVMLLFNCVRDRACEQVEFRQHYKKQGYHPVSPIDLALVLLIQQV